MGKIEEKNKKAIRRTKLQEAILLTIASGGKLGSSTLIPAVLNYFLKNESVHNSRKSEVTRSTLSRLTKKGLLKFENNHYLLSSSGEETLEQWRKNDFEFKKPNTWDQKWRLIIFDIPEKRRGVRDEIRNIFINAGLRRLQDSVWVYPYDCEDIIGLLKTDYKIGKDLLYVIADQIENDKYLRDEFGLMH